MASPITPSDHLDSVSESSPSINKPSHHWEQPPVPINNPITADLNVLFNSDVQFLGTTAPAYSMANPWQQIDEMFGLTTPPPPPISPSPVTAPQSPEQQYVPPPGPPLVHYTGQPEQPPQQPQMTMDQMLA